MLQPVWSVRKLRVLCGSFAASGTVAARADVKFSCPERYDNGRKQ